MNARKKAQDPTPQEVQEADWEVEKEGAEGSAEPQLEQKALVPAGASSAMNGHTIHPLVQLEEAMQARELLDQLITTHMRAGTDFAIIPGTSKPSLLKPGAEKAVTWFGLTITFPQKLARHVENHAAGFFHYTYTCQLLDRRSGIMVAECEGSANTKEARFATYKSKKRDEPGKPRNPFDQINSVQKMAQKRAMVGAVLFGCALSEHFTQDTEDMNPEDLAMSGYHDQEPFTLKDEATGGKYGGQTWEWICLNDPDYASWACGRKSNAPEGMKKLGKEAHQMIGAELDRLNATMAQDTQAQDPTPPPATKPIPPAPPEARQHPFAYLWTQALLVTGVTQEQAAMYARAHKLLPSDMSTWGEAEFQRGMDDVKKFGWPKLLWAAEKKLQQQAQLDQQAQAEAGDEEPPVGPPEVPQLPKKLREEGTRALERAEHSGLPAVEQYRVGLEGFQEMGNEREYTKLLDGLKEAYLHHLATHQGQKAREQAKEPQKGLGL